MISLLSDSSEDKSVASGTVSDEAVSEVTEVKKSTKKSTK